MSERDLNEAGSAVYLKLSKNDDKVCKQALLGAKLLGHGDFEYGIHATLLLPQGEADLTCEGVGLYKWTNPFEDNDCRLIYAFDYYYSSLSWEIASALYHSRCQMKLRDLARCGLGHRPVGLVCTTFCGLLLGMDDEAPFMPLELVKLLAKQTEGGRLWRRNKENNEWYRALVPTGSTTILHG